MEKGWIGIEFISVLLRPCHLLVISKKKIAIIICLLS